MVRETEEEPLHCLIRFGSGCDQCIRTKGRSFNGEERQIMQPNGTEDSF